MGYTPVGKRTTFTSFACAIVDSRASFFLSLLRLPLLLAYGAIAVHAQIRALALDQTKYEVQAGAAVEIAASGDNLDFLLKSQNRNILPASGVVVGLNHAGDHVML